MTLGRRELLRGAGALAGLGMLPREARAAAPELRFVFVVASGGWDPTRVLARSWDTPGADVEPGAEPLTLGDLSVVDHPSRPAVRAFLERWQESALVLNGLLVRSIAHDSCRRLLMTGGPVGDTPDWAAILAAEAREDYLLPHVVLGGPSFAGELGDRVARTGAYGQLAELLDGTALEGLDQEVAPLPGPAQALVERFLARRGAAWIREHAADEAAAISLAWEASRARAARLADARLEARLGRAGDFPGRIDAACALLASGTSRCVTLDTGSSSLWWDTHTENDPRQAPLWEELFVGLARLLERLAAQSGPDGTPLLEQTCVVVLSEMGRTPRLNALRGKDHWPWTSALLLGAGIAGGRTLGGYDGSFTGRPIDPVGGGFVQGGVIPTSSGLGASLLALGGVDPARWTDSETLLLG